MISFFKVIYCSIFKYLLSINFKNEKFFSFIFIHLEINN